MDRVFSLTQGRRRMMFRVSLRGTAKDHRLPGHTHTLMTMKMMMMTGKMLNVMGTTISERSRMRRGCYAPWYPARQCYLNPRPG